MKKTTYQSPMTAMTQYILSDMIVTSPPFKATGGIGTGGTSDDGTYNPYDGTEDSHDGNNTGYIGWGGESDSGDEVGAKKSFSLWDD